MTQIVFLDEREQAVTQAVGLTNPAQLSWRSSDVPAPFGVCLRVSGERDQGSPVSRDGASLEHKPEDNLWFFDGLNRCHLLPWSLPLLC